VSELLFRVCRLEAIGRLYRGFGLFDVAEAKKVQLIVCQIAPRGECIQIMAVRDVHRYDV
jgi:hypothetical protein